MRQLFDAIVDGRGGQERAGALWALVLAGGEGRRLAEVSRARYGYPRPKQYCAFGGDRSLLELTVERAHQVVRPERVVVATQRGHRAEASECLGSLPRARRVEQPGNGETLPGILLPVLDTLAVDPHAVVVVLPADHHVDDSVAFGERIRLATSIVREEPEQVLLLGASFEAPEEGYGWIVPGAPRGPHRRAVAGFREKPGRDELATLLDDGALANTFVMVAKGWRLAGLIRDVAPRWWEALAEGVFAPPILERAYRDLPPRDFSRAVLETRTDALSVMPLGPLGWSDVGTPERLDRALPFLAA